jgi:tetratricopeptide (TPR) repeat protein
MSGQVPSRGARWAGAIIRVTDPREPFTLEGASRRIARAFRLRSMGRPRGLFEELLASYYAQSMYVQGVLALKEGDARLALSMAALGGYFNAGLPEVAELKARALSALGFRSAAFGWWKRAIKLTPGGTYLDPYLGLAALAGKDGDGDQELEYTRMAALAGGGRGDPGIAGGDEARAAGRRKDALRLYRAAAARVLASRGMAYFQGGKLPQAGSSWEDALALDPGQAQALQNLGSIAALEERFTDALAWYRRAGAVAPGSSELAENIAKAKEGLAWLPRIPRLESAVSAGPGDPGRWVELGNAYWFAGRARSAEAAYRRALRLDPGNARAWSNLSSALVNQGRVDEAIAACRAAIKADPRYVEASLNLAAIYRGMGWLSGVEETLLNAWKANPGDARLAAAMRAAGVNPPAAGKGPGK